MLRWLRTSTPIPSSGDADVGLAQGGRIPLPKGKLKFAGIMNQTRVGDYAIIEFFSQDASVVPLDEGIIEHNRGMNVRWQGELDVDNGMYVQPRIISGTAADTIVLVVGVELE